jgi:hypothetical protein
MQCTRSFFCTVVEKQSCLQELGEVYYVPSNAQVLRQEAKHHDKAARTRNSAYRWADESHATLLPSPCGCCTQVVHAGSEPPPGQTSSTPAAAAAGGPSDGPWPLYLQLSNGDCLGVDLLVQAIGVEPATEWLPGTSVICFQHLVCNLHASCCHLVGAGSAATFARDASSLSLV